MRDGIRDGMRYGMETMLDADQTVLMEKKKRYFLIFF